MKLRQRVSNVFIISAELNLLPGTSPLFQNSWTRVEQKFSLFFQRRSACVNVTYTSHLTRCEDVTDAFRRSARIDHAIAQGRPVTDARFQFVSITNWPDPRGRSGQNQIAWQQRQRLARERNNLCHRVNHLAGARFLAHFAVLPQFQRQIANIDIGINKRPDWRVSIERFAAPKLLFRLLQVAIADIETDRIAENKVERLSGRK